MAERRTGAVVTDDEFWDLLHEKLRPYPPMHMARFYAKSQEEIAQLPPARALLLYAIQDQALEHRDAIPVALKNELKYLDADLNFHREVALKIQRFRIAEDEYNGADEDEPWWKLGRNCETEPPSQRLTQRVPLDQGWPEDGSSLIVVDR